MARDEPDQPSFFPTERGTAVAAPSLGRRLLFLTPSAAVAIASAPFLSAAVRAPLMLLALLIAPGLLLWWCLRGPIARSVVSAPAVWFACSIVVLIPPAMLFMLGGVPAWTIPAYAAAVMAFLGWIAASTAAPVMRRPATLWWLWLIGAMAVASAFRASELDQATHISFINVIAESSLFPRSNPFMGMDMPLAPRWRLNGWDALLGAIVRLTDAHATTLVLQVVRPLTLVLGASATYLLARFITASDRLAAVTTVVAAVAVPVLLVEQDNESPGRLWLAAGGEDKSVAMLILLPIAIVVVLRLLDHPHRRRFLGAAALLFALLLVHPLMLAFTLVLTGGYAVAEGVVARTIPTRRLALIAAAVAPAVIVGLAMQVTSPAFGGSMSVVASVSDVAEPRQIGPVTIWEPFHVLDGRAREYPDFSTALIARKLSIFRYRYIIIGRTIMPSPGLLIEPIFLVTIAGCFVLIVRCRQRRLRLWVAVSTVIALLPFLVPPAAMVLGKLIAPWLLWRFLWLLPLPLVTAWLLQRALQRHVVEAIAAVVIAGVTVTAFSVTPWGEPEVWPGGAARAIADVEGVLMTPSEYRRWIPVEGSHLRVVGGSTITGLNNFPRDRLAEIEGLLTDHANVFTPDVPLVDRRRALEIHGVTHVLIHRSERDRIEGLPVGGRTPLPQGFRLFTVKERGG